MKLLTEDETIDLADLEARTEAWETIRQSMKLGFTTPENMTPEQRATVRAFFSDLPVIKTGNARRGEAYVIGITDLVEGQDWCYATSRDGTFGVFPLDEGSNPALRGGVLHLWIDDGTDDPHDSGRLDFVDTGAYMEAALDAALSYGVAA